MRKSRRVRLGDLRRAYRLTHACRDVGQDPTAWPALLADGLKKLLGSQVIVVGKIELAPGSPPRNHHIVDSGWDSDQHRDQWYRRHLVNHDYQGVETFRRFVEGLSGLKTRSRDQLVGDPEWYRSFEFNEINRAIGLDDLLPSYAPIGDGREIFGFINARPLGEPRFDQSTRRLLNLFHIELGRLLGKSILLDAAGPIGDLPPRLRRTLDCLLDGDSESQAALRLGLSKHTVHEYVIDLYRRFGVGSRRELMAFCHRLGPTGRRESKP
jgi:DNA-binding CsgD family transcriptional regulator